MKLSRCSGRGPMSALTVVALTFALTSSAAGPTAAKFTALSPVPAPAIELKDTSGKFHRLSDYKGKVVVVNFWATWCEPCREEMPSLQRLKERIDQDKRRTSALVILAVNYNENIANVDKFLKAVKVEFPVLIDSFGLASSTWKPGVLPASFMIGRDGRMYYRVIGELDWAGMEAVSVVERLIDAKG
jgi:thiol-disulfide isomerase/thioredoxin